jgi:hypothetical protein
LTLGLDIRTKSVEGAGKAWGECAEAKSGDQSSDIWGQVVQELTGLDISAKGIEGTSETWGECAQSEAGDQSSDIRREVVQELGHWGGESAAGKSQSDDCLVVNHDEGFGDEDEDGRVRVGRDRVECGEKRIFFVEEEKRETRRKASLYTVPQPLATNMRTGSSLDLGMRCYDRQNQIVQ